MAKEVGKVVDVEVEAEVKPPNPLEAKLHKMVETWYAGFFQGTGLVEPVKYNQSHAAKEELKKRITALLKGKE